ncbi:MAG: Gfo/Idh/MocA family oxidoreductase [Steroidobacteraceae bacterium]|jgi:predicted dehydrogenase
MRTAIVGCGFVADFYMQSLPLYPVLELAAVTDRDPVRLAQFAGFHGLTCARDSLDGVLSDPSIELVLNLTNPDSHYEVSKACLLAGKHVYSEKPLAMRMEEATELLALAQSRGLQIASAPCNVLGETAQTVWKALRERRIGDIKLVYAELDDGMVFHMPYRKWFSASGRQWPYKDEFEVGCTLEHAGYYVTWMTAFFGPAASVTAFASCLYPDKLTDVPLDRDAPDLSVACIQFESGVVCRLTCTIIAQEDHRLRMFGDRGILSVEDCWNYHSPVVIKRMFNIRRRTIIEPIGRRYPLVRIQGTRQSARGSNKMQFCRGPAEMASAVQERRQSRLPADFCLHNNEIVLAIQNATENGSTHRLRTSFKAAPQPMLIL